MNINFDPRLESLRGIAALIVAVHHGMTLFVAAQIDPVSSVVLGYTHPSSAVFLFFVLSGYVLGQSFQRAPAFADFALRRAFRILPMFVLSVLVTYICLSSIRVDPWPSDVTPFFQLTHPLLVPQDILDNLMFRNSRVNGPSWSIYPEIGGSLLLPLLIYAHLKTPARYAPLLFLALVVALAATPVKIVLWFYIGFWLPTVISRWMADHWSARVVPFLAGYYILLCLGPGSVVTHAGTSIPASIGASLMIAAVIASAVGFPILRARPLRFLGRVSYSFYLLHWCFFYLAAMIALSFDWFPRGHTGNLLVCSSSIAIALLVSWATYSWVEAPLMTIAKKGLRTLRDRPAPVL